MAEEQGQAPARDLGKILSLVFVVLNLVVLGAGSYLVFASTLGYHSPASTEADIRKQWEQLSQELQAHPVMYTMEPFNTNLDGVPRRLIRVRVNLEMLDEEGFEEVINMGAEARDAIVRILNARTYDDIESVQGKLRLKNQIVTQLNEFLERGVVKNVYFSEFAIQ